MAAYIQQGHLELHQNFEGTQFSPWHHAPTHFLWQCFTGLLYRALALSEIPSFFFLLRQALPQLPRLGSILWAFCFRCSECWDHSRGPTSHLSSFPSIWFLQESSCVELCPCFPFRSCQLVGAQLICCVGLCHNFARFLSSSWRVLVVSVYDSAPEFSLLSVQLDAFFSLNCSARTSSKMLIQR